MADKKERVVLTAVGSDRPGLVSEISALIGEHGGNIEDSRMAVLGGEFALVLLFSATEGAAARIEQASEASSKRLGLELFFKHTEANQPKDSLGYRLQVTGLDHPGIVKRVTSVLSRFAINVLSLDTSLVHAPMTGTPTFVLRADIDLPPAVSVSKAREALLATCEEDNLDCAMEPRI